MPTTLITPKSIGVSEEKKSDVTQSVQLGRWSCLIVSSSIEHQNLFCRAAIACGWQTSATADPHEALKFMCRNSVKLAFVDFQDVVAERENYRSFADYIKWVGGVLLVINGPERDSQFHDSSLELWARQLGAWSYVPGLLPEGDLSNLCDQALRVVEKLHNPKH